MNGFYRHERFLDVYVYVLKIQYRGIKYYKVKIEWWLRGSTTNIRQTIKIMKNDFKYWWPCDFNGRI